MLSPGAELLQSLSIADFSPSPDFNSSPYISSKKPGRVFDVLNDSFFLLSLMNFSGHAELEATPSIYVL